MARTDRPTPADPTEVAHLITGLIGPAKPRPTADAPDWRHDDDWYDVTNADLPKPTN